MAELPEQSRIHPALEGKPTEIDLDTVSKNAGDKWRSFLTHLGVPLAKCKALFVESRGDPVSACFEGLVFWREGNEPCRPPTWSVLLEALEKGAEKREYTQSLREDLIGSSNISQRRPSFPVSQAQPTRALSTMDERSKKIKEIVDKYRNGEGEISLPENPDLEEKFDRFMSKKFLTKLSSADPGRISEIRAMMRMKYCKIVHGVRPVPLPPVPSTADGLFDFIGEKSNFYEILLVHHAVEVLEDEDLKKDLQEYESKLAEHLREMLTSCKRRRVTLPLRKDHTHMAIVISKEQVLLSLVLEMKEYFSKYLQLEETFFEGFEEGCTVLFFSILTVDAALLSPKVLSHLSELKRMFGMTHLIVFGYFACDLEKATIELVSGDEDVISLKVENNQLESRISVLENELMAARMKLKLKEEQLDQSTREAEKYKRVTIELYGEKSALDTELKKVKQRNTEHKDPEEQSRSGKAKLLLEVSKKEPQVFQSDVLLSGSKLQSIQLPPLPIPTCRATAVIIGMKIYVGGGACSNVESAQLVQVYDTITAEWTTLPPSPIYNTELTLVNGQLTLIGGRDASTGEITNSTITWDEEKKQWFPKVPPMPTKRGRPCIIHCNNLMLVAGGKASDNKTLLDSVDVFNMDTFQWTTTDSLKLPLPMWGMRASIIGNYVYITSGMDRITAATDVAYKVHVDEVDRAVTKDQGVVLIKVESTPHYASGLVADSDHPIVVGGHKSDKPTSDVSIYDPTTDKWSNVGQCASSHFQSCAIAVSSSAFVAIGGRTNPSDPRSSSVTNFELFYVQK